MARWTKLARLVMPFVALTLAPTARAEESSSPEEPRLFRESAELTRVPSAFDEGHPFDVDFVLGFTHRIKTANIRRETALAGPGLSDDGYVAATENVARFTQARSELLTGADIGLYRDLALVFRLPIVLADARDLADLDGSSANPTRLMTPDGDMLFNLPQKSPTRSGIDWMKLGVRYAIFNQVRDRTKPTWVIGAGTRIAVGSPMRACTSATATMPASCGDPADRSKPVDPGISRGTDALELETQVSRRYGSIEPYLAFGALMEFARSSSAFRGLGTSDNASVRHLPLRTHATIGVEFVPWSRLERHQRVVLDAHAHGQLITRGRDYSELFDALGASNARALTTPNPGAFHLGPDGMSSVADPNVQSVTFTGATTVDTHAAMGGSLGATWQAGEHLKFTASGGLTFVQAHALSTSGACNTSLDGSSAAQGPCQSGGRPTGTPNPHHRAVIDDPGHRFVAEDTKIIHLWFGGIVMF